MLEDIIYDKEKYQILSQKQQMVSMLLEKLHKQLIDYQNIWRFIFCW